MRQGRLTAQREALHALGVAPDRVYIDHGISGTKRERPSLDQALAAVRTGDTLATFATFEVDLIRMRTREGMALKRMHQTGEYTFSDLGELFSVSRPTAYRTISRTHPKKIGLPD